MDQNTSKRILIVGAASKIASHFIRSCPPAYELYGTNGVNQSDLLSPERQFRVDLTDSEQIGIFLNTVSGTAFDAVLFFAATYSPDPKGVDDYLDAYQTDLQLNVASIVAIAKGVTFTDHSKFFVFGDAGLEHPKKGFTSYSISKFAVADLARMLAVELAPHTATFCLRLGPTLKEDVPMDDSYYQKGLLRTSSPVQYHKLIFC